MNHVNLLTDVQTLIDRWGKHAILETMQFIHAIDTLQPPMITLRAVDYYEGQSRLIEVQISREDYNAVKETYPHMNKISAIKALRSATNPTLGLRDAKLIVEQTEWV